MLSEATTLRSYSSWGALNAGAPFSNTATVLRSLPICTASMAPGKSFWEKLARYQALAAPSKATRFNLVGSMLAAESKLVWM